MAAPTRLPPRRLASQGSLQVPRLHASCLRIRAIDQEPVMTHVDFSTVRNLGLFQRSVRHSTPPELGGSFRRRPMKVFLPRSLWLPGTLALLLLGSSTNSSAETFIAFGPVQYSRDTGKPTPVTKIFNVL